MAGVALDAQRGNGPQIPALFLGAAAVIVIPIFYGVFGFITGIIYAALYNLIAAVVGGLELEFERPVTQVGAP
jgi:hypothetical protein